LKAPIKECLNHAQVRFENVDTFLRKIFTHLKPQSDAVVEKQKREQFLKTIADFGKTKGK
jgi:hypothetical protein